MITQQQALDKTIKAHEEQLPSDLKKLDIRVRLASEKGEYSVSVEEMNPILKDELRKLGYNVFTDNQDNWKVGWKKSV